MLKSGIFGQTAKFGQPSCLFHSSIIEIKNLSVSPDIPWPGLPQTYVPRALLKNMTCSESLAFESQTLIHRLTVLAAYQRSSKCIKTSKK